MKRLRRRFRLALTALLVVFDLALGAALGPLAVGLMAGISASDTSAAVAVAQLEEEEIKAKRSAKTGAAAQAARRQGNHPRVARRAVDLRLALRFVPAEPLRRPDRDDTTPRGPPRRLAPLRAPPAFS